MLCIFVRIYLFIFNLDLFVQLSITGLDILIAYKFVQAIGQTRDAELSAEREVTQKGRV